MRVLFTAFAILLAASVTVGVGRTSHPRRPSAISLVGADEVAKGVARPDLRLIQWKVKHGNPKAKKRDQRSKADVAGTQKTTAPKKAKVVVPNSEAFPSPPKRGKDTLSSEAAADQPASLSSKTRESHPAPTKAKKAGNKDDKTTPHEKTTSVKKGGKLSTPGRRQQLKASPTAKEHNSEKDGSDQEEAHEEPEQSSDGNKMGSSHKESVESAPSLGSAQSMKELFTAPTQTDMLLSKLSCPDCEQADSKLWERLPATSRYEKNYNTCLLVGFAVGDCGRVIDGYDAVIRFNGRVPATADSDLAVQTGTKVTHMFMNSNDNNVVKDLRPLGAEVFHQVSHVDAQGYFTSNQHRLEAAMDVGWHQLNFRWITEVITKERKLMGNDEVIPSSGFLAFLFMESKCKKIDFLGFDKDPAYKGFEGHQFDLEHQVEQSVRPDAKFLNKETCEAPTDAPEAY